MTFGGVTRVPLVATVLVGAACAAAAEPSGVPAFPGAEGAGRMAVGGRGGRVLTVTTLADYDPKSQQSPIVGSLRWAVSQSGPRIVVFRVGGIVELKAGLSIKEPRLTIAGQTAPGDGICLRDGPLVVAADDVVVRHLRVRLGDVQAKEADAISVLDCRRVVLDHCSASWSVDEALSVTGGGCGDVTVQWCIISESLDKSRHRKGTHGYGSLVRTDGEVSFHHNLYAHHRTRCPRPGTYGDPPGLLFDFRNNVIYDWISPAGYTSSDPVRMNYVSNALRPGPSTREKVFMFSVGGPATRIYAAGNTLDHPRTAAADDWTLIEHAKPANRLDAPLQTVAVTTDSAPEAFARVLRSAGATLPRRDAVDARVVEDVRRGTGKVVDSQRDVGGWPDYRTAEAAPDADADGMPDSWERDHGLDPRAEADGAADRDGDGYTNVEEYLNGIGGD